jgi:hypothetical protein
VVGVVVGTAVLLSLFVGMFVRNKRKRAEAADRDRLAKGLLRNVHHARNQSTSHTPLQSDIAGLKTFDDLLQTRSVESQWGIPFELLDLGVKIGAGGSGQVWKAIFQGREVAVKELYQGK